MSRAATETVILCEGYHDRAFWAAILEDHGWRDARPLRGGSLGTAVDPFGKNVVGGDFAFKSSAGAFLRVRPCHGASKVLERMKERLVLRATAPVEHLIVNLDTDATDVALDAAAQVQVAKAVRDRVRTLAPDMIETEDGDLLVDGGQTRISTVLWSAPDAASPELPDKQTLERLVCAALRDVYPDRARAVSAWLAGRPSPPAPCSKSYKAHAWSHMAGWYPEHGCDDFFRLLWRPGEAVVENLRQRLRVILPASVQHRLLIQPILQR